MAFNSQWLASPSQVLGLQMCITKPADSHPSVRSWHLFQDQIFVFILGPGQLLFGLGTVGGEVGKAWLWGEVTSGPLVISHGKHGVSGLCSLGL